MDEENYSNLYNLNLVRNLASDRLYLNNMAWQVQQLYLDTDSFQGSSTLAVEICHLIANNCFQKL
jgi:hypothetical protein